jgi:RNA ligase
MQEIKIMDFPKVECPFVRKMIDGNYVVTNEIAEGMDWVFNDDTVFVTEKLDGTNVSVLIQDGHIMSVWNRSERIPFFNKGKKHIIDGVYNSFVRGHLEMLPDGQHFGELIGPKLNGNPYKMDEHLWIPFKTYAVNHLTYKSFGKYPKNFDSFSEWMKTLRPLFGLIRGLGEDSFVEGVVFNHPDGRIAKLRKDMYPWWSGDRHKSNSEVSK